MVNSICQNEAEIFAFEPIPKVFTALNRNLTKYNSSGKAKAFNLGIGKQAHTKEFIYYPNATAISTMYPDRLGVEKQQFALTMVENIDELPAPLDLIAYLPKPISSFVIDRLVDFAYMEQKVQCQVKTISQIIEEQSIRKIDLLKIDVEKAELDVLQGINLEDWSKIKQLVVEVHDINGRVQNIQNLLKKTWFFADRNRTRPYFQAA